MWELEAVRSGCTTHSRAVRSSPCHGGGSSVGPRFGSANGEKRDIVIDVRIHSSKSLLGKNKPTLLEVGTRRYI